MVSTKTLLLKHDYRRQGKSPVRITMPKKNSKTILLCNLYVAAPKINCPTIRCAMMQCFWDRCCSACGRGIQWPRENRTILGGNFDPEKKYLGPWPPPPIPREHPPGPSLPAPTRLPAIFKKNRPAPPPGASDSPFPSPRAGKYKKYPKRPPSICPFGDFPLFLKSVLSTLIATPPAPYRSLPGTPGPESRKSPMRLIVVLLCFPLALLAF